MNQRHYNELLKIAADLETEGETALASALRDALRGPSDAAPAEAWKLVPVEPTAAMLYVAQWWHIKRYGIGIGNKDATAMWKVMLGAATRLDAAQAPVAWMHTMHMERGQTKVRIETSAVSPFGVPGEDYSAEYRVTCEPLYAAPVAPAAAAPHTDDLSVEMFALAMKDKMRQAREKGRGGWEMCSREELSRMLREHVAKGDPRDVANFCMMLWHLDAPIMAAAQPDERAAISEGEIIDVIKSATGKFRTNDSYSFEDVWNCIEAAFKARVDREPIGYISPSLLADLRKDREIVIWPRPIGDATLAVYSRATKSTK